MGTNLDGGTSTAHTPPLLCQPHTAAVATSASSTQLNTPTAVLAFEHANGRAFAAL